MTWKYDGQIIDESQIYDIVIYHYDYERYDEMLDDYWETVKICGFEYSPSHALKMVDKVAYECGYNDEISYIADEIIYNHAEMDYTGFGIEYIED